MQELKSQASTLIPDRNLGSRLHAKDTESLAEPSVVMLCDQSARGTRQVVSWFLGPSTAAADH